MPVNQSQSGRTRSRREAVRRHRRERQIVVFGVVVIALGALAIAAAAVYRGDAPGVFSQPIHTPAGDFESDVRLVCPASDSTALPYGEVVVRVNNGTQVNGLAGNVRTTLEGRGFLVSGAQNWPRSYSGTALIYHGAAGVQQAYTLGTQFESFVLVLDNRPDITLDLVVGEAFGENPQLRGPLEPELDPEYRLAPYGECLPANLVEAEPAPRNLPANPLADPEPTATPDEETIEGEDGAGGEPTNG